MKNKIESIISAAFTSGIIFVFSFFILLLFSSFSTVFLEMLNFSESSNIKGAGIIVQAFVVSIIITLIIASISISFSLLGTFLSSYVAKSRKDFSAADYESQFFKQYESPSDAGQYHRKNEDDDF